MSTSAPTVRSSSISSSATRLWIPIGAGLFVIALTGSAIVVPQLWFLHMLQAMIYIAVVILGRRGNVFALGAGITIAIVWNSLELFGPHNMQRGMVLFWSFLRNGQGRQFDTMLVPLGGLGHCILLAACTFAFFEQEKSRRSWWKLIAGGVIVLAYFALIVVIALPRQGS